MPASYVPRLVDLPDVFANGGKVPASALGRTALVADGGGQAGQPNATNNPCVRVDHFWLPGDTGLGTRFLWEFWVKWTFNGYILSDGYSGNHALLLGILGLPGAMSGNVYAGANLAGAAAQPFAGSYAIAAGEWVHIRVSWDGSFVYTHVNGVCDGVTAVTGTRFTTPTGGGGGTLFLFGSDHINGGGSIAAAYGWDRGQALSGYFTEVQQGIAPGFVPSRMGLLRWPLDGTPADYYAACNLPPGTAVVPDLAPVGTMLGTETFPARHPGLLWNNGGDAGNGINPVGTLPRFEVDETCPFGQPVGSALPAETIPAPGAVPGGARIFDSFGRRNQTPAFQAAPTLGSTEGGSLGPLPWSQGTTGGYAARRPGSRWGILGGCAAYLDYGPSAAWVENGAADMDVRVTRLTGGGATGGVGLCWRLVDKDNYWLAFLLKNSGVYLLRYGFYAGGAYTIQGAGINLGATVADTQLRAVTTGTTHTLFTGDGATWTSRDVWTSSTHLAATKCGLSTDHDAAFSGSQAKYRNFTVF